MKKHVEIIFIAVICIIVLFALLRNYISQEILIETPKISPSENEFCGSSTYGRCDKDDECIKNGCSAQICRSIYEEGFITTCEWRECYNATKYGLECKCINHKCQWA